jgi:hypothetical protein
VTAREFLQSRAPWLRVEAIDRPGGGWDVVLVIDGTYFTEVEPPRQAMVDHYTDWLAAVLDAEDIDLVESLGLSWPGSRRDALTPALHARHRRRSESPQETAQ